MFGVSVRKNPCGFWESCAVEYLKYGGVANFLRLVGVDNLACMPISVGSLCIK